MSASTGIQWTDATWNPIRGCSRVSDGCRHCYAEVVAARFSGRGQPYEGLARRTSNGEARWTGKIMFVEKHLLDPIRWQEPKRIFVNSMSDLFHKGVTDQQLDTIFAVMVLASRHTFQVLTKRPERQREYIRDPQRTMLVNLEIRRILASLGGNAKRLDARCVDEWPPQNFWPGVSVENQKAADERIPILLDTPGSVRFLSCEPLLGPVNLQSAIRCPRCEDYGELCTCRSVFDGLSWVIVGGESGSHARPCNVQWIRRIVDQCRAASVAVFVKQLGAKPGFTLDDEERRGNTMPSYHHFDSDAGLYIKKMNEGHGSDPSEWPTELRVRDFPRAEVPA